MSLFIESIRVINGKAELLSFHQARLDRTFAHFFNAVKPFNLTSVIQQNPPPDNKLYKLRIEYSNEMTSIEYQPYEKREIKSLQVVELPEDFKYSYKFTDRSVLNSLSKNIKEDTLPIFIQRGMPTDSLYTNLIFKDKNALFTPKIPLLNGVQREYLLKSKIIKAKSILLKDIQKFEGVYLINAMMPLNEAVFIPSCQIG